MPWGGVNLAWVAQRNNPHDPMLTSNQKPLMYKKAKYTILSHKALNANVMELVLKGETKYIKAPGQFVEIELPGKFLRRPLSVCAYEKGQLTLIYKIVGEGTEILAKLPVGTELDLITGLGNGFTIDPKHHPHPLLVGGGVGLPPLYQLCKDLLKSGKKPTVVMGFNTKDEAFYFNEFCKLGIDVWVSTVDGTGGTKGYVTDAMVEHGVVFDYIYACGPLPMLYALLDATIIDGQFSFEERMGCGFGVCMGCSIMTANGSKRVCKEGPIFTRQELIPESFKLTPKSEA